MAENGDATGEVMKIGRRCYVGNLPWRTSWQDLKDKFRECGNVVYANVVTDQNGRSKGWGIVEFELPEEALRAVNELSGQDFGGRRLLVREDREDRDVKEEDGEGGAAERPRRERRPPRNRDAPAQGEQDTRVSSGLQIVVQGIPWSYTWREMKDMFSEFGDVARADVVTGRDGRSRGYGTVRFNTKEEAQAAIAEWDGKELEGRVLTVKLDKWA